MSEIYITKANTNLILNSLQKHLTEKKDRAYFLSNLSEFIDVDLLNSFFSDMELKNIYYEKNILQNLENLLNNIKDNKNMIINYITQQNRKYAYDIKAPSYHTTIVCQWLNKDFTNIEMPKEIQNNELLLKKFKAFIDRNKHVNSKELNEKYQNQFDTKDILKEVKHKNSGNLHLDNTKVFSEIKEYTLSLTVDNIIKNYRYAPSFRIDKLFKDKRDTDEYKKVKNFHEIKQKLMNVIFSEHKEKYNEDLSFNKSLLDDIGFRECKGCASYTDSSNLYPHSIAS